MSKVFVLDANKQALNPVYPGRARLLLKAGKAAVYRHYPFTIILKRHGGPSNAPAVARQAGSRQQNQRHHADQRWAAEKSSLPLN